MPRFGVSFLRTLLSRRSFRSTFHHSAVHHSAVHHSAVHHSAVRHSAVLHSAFCILYSAFFILSPTVLTAQAKPDPRLDRLKTELARTIDGQAKLAQQMVDQVFSFGELGMQEVETSKYLAGILERNGFTVERGVAGIPTEWVARWGSGSPVIAL